MIVVQKYINLFFLVLIITCLSACNNNRWEADASQLKVNTNITRYEKAVFNMDSANWQQEFDSLKTRFPDMTELTLERIFRFGRVDDEAAQQRFRKFIVFNNYYRDSLYPDIVKTFPDEEIHKLEENLQQPFKRIKYFYPKDILPKLFTSFSGYGYQVVTYENSLAISLDMFLGENYRYYASLEFPVYQTRRFRKEYIVPEVLKTIFMAKYDERKLVDQTLLSNMIQAGKTLYFAEVMAPEINDTLKTGYTGKQLKWCKENEGEMWRHFTTQNILFTTDQYIIAKYLGEAPFTSAEGVPAESAPRLGEWVGWQIVRSYMDENRDISLDALFKEKDYKKILRDSKYKPK